MYANRVFGTATCVQFIEVSSLKDVLIKGFPCTSLHAGDPRRPYPQDIEMRSGFLGGFVPSAAPPADQGKFGTNLTSLEPPEKKIALDKGGTIVLQGNCKKIP